MTSPQHQLMLFLDILVTKLRGIQTPCGFRGQNEREMTGTVRPKVRMSHCHHLSSHPILPPGLGGGDLNHYAKGECLNK